LFKIPSKIRLKIDKLRKKKLWYGGHAVKKKMHWLLGILFVKVKLNEV
jgi:hypothetical protein